MPQTTTQITACDAGVWLDDASGTPQDISGSSNTVSLTITMDSGMRRSFGSRWPTRAQCAKDASASLQIIYSTASDEAMDILRNWVFADNPGSRTLSIYLPDKNVGSDHYSGEWVIDGDVEIPIEAGVSDPILVSLPLSITGELSHTTATT